MKTALDVASGAAISLAVLYGLWNRFGAFGLVFATWLYHDVAKPARNRLERGMPRAK